MQAQTTVSPLLQRESFPELQSGHGLVMMITGGIGVAVTVTTGLGYG
jgi:hypothetical protein